MIPQYQFTVFHDTMTTRLPRLDFDFDFDSTHLRLRYGAVYRLCTVAVSTVDMCGISFTFMIPQYQFTVFHDTMTTRLPRLFRLRLDSALSTHSSTHSSTRTRLRRMKITKSSTICTSKQCLFVCTIG
jgi:hypothetical protein